MTAIEFSHPSWLVFIPIVVVFAVLSGIFWFNNRQGFIDFFGKGRGRIHSRGRITAYLTILCLIVAIMGILLCGPFMARQVTVDVYEPVQIVLAVDISKSMLAAAVQHGGKQKAFPCQATRLKVVQQQILQFIDEAGMGKAIHVGLVVFARFAYPAIPIPTEDYQLFVRRLNKEILPENVLSMAEGSNHWYALEISLGVLDKAAGHEKVLVFLTDGEPDAPDGVLTKSREEALKLRSKHPDLAIHVIGIGSPGRRQPVPAVWLPNGCPDLQYGYIQQETPSGSGEVMLTMTDPEKLNTFAEQVKGKYLHSSTGTDLAADLQYIVDQKRRKIGVEEKTILFDLSPYLIILILALLAILILLKTP